MFPPANFDPQSQRWVNKVQGTLTSLESIEPRITSELDALQRQNNSVLDDVTSNVNAYYEATLAQYPAFQRTVPMRHVLGAETKVVSISAPFSDDDAPVAETWVDVFSENISLPASVAVAGVRLNSAQFRIQGPSTYYLGFRFLVGTITEGINSTIWMSRHQFNLSTYQMDATNPTLTNISNRYVHWTGTSTNSIAVKLQARIEDSTNTESAVSAQNITFHGTDNNDRNTYLDVMVTT